MQFFRAMALCAALWLLVSSASGESAYAARIRIMNTSTKWYVVTYYVVGKPLTETRSVDKSPMSHSICTKVAQQMNEAAEIGEVDGALPRVFNRCEPAELTRAYRSD